MMRLLDAYGLPIKETTGDVEYLHYFRGEFDKIALEYSEREFDTQNYTRRCKKRWDGLKRGPDACNKENDDASK